MNTSQPDKNVGYIRWKTWDADKFGEVNAKDNATFSCELRRAGIKLSSDSSVLEIGFGNGAFAGWVRQQTPHYVGTEDNPELVSRARRMGIEAHSATLNLDTIAQGRAFDLIAFFDILEHLDKNEILEILGSAGRCLSHQGRIIIRVPSGDSPFAGHLMHGDLTHKSQLGSYAFYQLATLTGLQVISVHDAAFPIFGLGASAAIRRIAILPARMIINSIIRATYFANKPVVMAPNSVAVMRVPYSTDPT